MYFSIVFTCFRFIKSVLTYLKTHHVDGIDIDWEFPNENNSHDKRQKIHFTQLLQEFRRAIDRQPEYNFLVTVAVAAPYFLIESSYDVFYMNKYVFSCFIFSLWFLNVLIKHADYDNVLINSNLY